jgi:signal transduction histidine kinase
VAVGAPERERRRDEILGAVALAGERLLEASSWREAIDKVLELIGSAAGADRATLVVCEACEDGTLQWALTHEWLAPGVPPSDGYWQRFVRPAIVARQLELGKPILFRLSEAVEERDALLSEGTRSSLEVPILLHGHLIGVVGFDDCVEERVWSAAEQEALRVAGGLIGTSMARERATATIRRREEVLAAVAAVSQQLVAATDWRTAIPASLEALGRAVQASRAYLFELNDAHTMSLTFEWDADDVESQLDNPVWQDYRMADGDLESFRQGKVFHALLSETTPALRSVLEAEGTRSVLNMPLFVGGRLWGLMGFDDTRREQRWSPDKIEALRAACGVLASVIERSRAVDALRERDAQLLQSQKLEAIGRLAGGLAHDFNNYLAVVIGYSEILRGQVDEDALEDVERILEAARGATELSRRLLAFSRPRPAEPDMVRLDELALEIEGILRALAGPSVDLVVSTPLSVLPVRADRAQIQQAIMNLVANAADAMPDGGTCAITVDQPGDAVRLQVEDTGYGMDDATRARIFEPFFTTKAGEEGTGIGLSTTLAIVSALGGTIDVESRAGGGTRFVVSLPAVAEAAFKAA